MTQPLRLVPPAASLGDVAGVPRVTWTDFLAHHFRWEQGEHVSMVGPTGCGKTTLGTAILPLRKYVTVLGTKPADRTLDRMVKTEGYQRIKRWKDRGRGGYLDPRKPARLILWPPFTGPDSFAVQRHVLEDAFGQMFAEGAWCVFADEVFYLCKQLGLSEWLETFWTQGRSVGLSLVAGTQRPAHVPLFLYDQATHLFLYRDNDETNLRRVAGIGGLSASQIRETVAALPRHDCLYVNTRDGRMVVTRADR